uniref:Uncharacterized protein n=1 Tax=Odontella aurita TaxID=265563 RepID=A0A7S4MV23_9STRA|mmetsp:Transcript_34386/g.102916  ORF Transcript_34386/g.102916 Transcript_34386/m.102916 type:complete len:148 (+) Transcript_34386:537-980(+)
MQQRNFSTFPETAFFIQLFCSRLSTRLLNPTDREFGLGKFDAWEAASAKVERRTPYMKEWGDGSIAETPQDATKLWEAAKMEEKRQIKDDAKRVQSQPLRKGRDVAHVKATQCFWNMSFSLRSIFASSVLGFAIGAAVSCRIRLRHE